MTYGKYFFIWTLLLISTSVAFSQSRTRESSNEAISEFDILQRDSIDAARVKQQKEWVRKRREIAKMTALKNLLSVQRNTRKDTVKSLSLSSIEIDEMPEVLNHLPNLKSLRLDNVSIELFAQLPTMPNIEYLSLKNNDLTAIPDFVFRMPNLRTG